MKSVMTGTGLMETNARTAAHVPSVGMACSRRGWKGVMMGTPSPMMDVALTVGKRSAGMASFRALKSVMIEVSHGAAIKTVHTLYAVTGS